MSSLLELYASTYEEFAWPPYEGGAEEGEEGVDDGPFFDAASADLFVVRCVPNDIDDSERNDNVVFQSEVARRLPDETRSDESALSYAEKFASRFKRGAAPAVQKLRWDVRTGVLARTAAVEILFDHRLYCPIPHQPLLTNALLALASPRQILELALREYERYGFVRRLEVATSILEAAGEQSLPALEWLIHSDSPHCVAFVDIVVDLKDVTPVRKSSLLRRLASNPHADVRLQLLDVLSEFPTSDIAIIAEQLSDDPDPDVRAAAADLVD